MQWHRLNNETHINVHIYSKTLELRTLLVLLIADSLEAIYCDYHSDADPEYTLSKFVQNI